MTNEEKILDYMYELNLEFNHEDLLPIYNHCGAIIVDSILQAGLNYKNVVLPRVICVLEKFRAFNTIAKFKKLIEMIGLYNIIEINNKRKIQTIIELVDLLYFDKIDSINQFRIWIDNESNRALLLSIKGIGPKTIDYIKKLLGIDAIPIDRHLFQFIKQADVELNKYYDVQKTLVNVADRIGVKLVSLDKSIWNFMSNI